MRSGTKRRAKPPAPREDRTEHVGTADFRKKLAKYLKHSEAGGIVVIRDRGRDAYVLTKLDAPSNPSGFGCMRERTEYQEDAVVNATEAWRPGKMPGRKMPGREMP